jgi:hypothetical protein
MRRIRLLIISATIAAIGALGVATAGADPAFGPGSGEQVGDRCHPPGQTVEVPGCK